MPVCSLTSDSRRLRDVTKVTCSVALTLSRSDPILSFSIFIPVSTANTLVYEPCYENRDAYYKDSSITGQRWRYNYPQCSISLARYAWARKSEHIVSRRKPRRHVISAAMLYPNHWNCLKGSGAISNNPNTATMGWNTS